MFKIVLLILFGLQFVPLFSQNHFIYLQSENKQPFEVSVNDKTYHSTGAGYIILSRLKSGTYDFIVKFDDTAAPVSKFTTLIDKKDVGFIVRDVGDNSVGLMNIQTYATLQALPVDTYVKNEKTLDRKPVEDNGASNPANIAKVPKSNTKKVGSKKESIPVVSTPALKKGINKISELQNGDNVSLLFIDVQGNVKDTIDVVIPAKKETSGPTGKVYGNSDESLFRWTSSTEIGYLYFIDPEFQEGYNTKCVHLLTKEDFSSLRKKMSASTNEDKMIREALKFSSQKCFTTQQVKSLSVLFPKDPGKYKFFSALYNHVYDYIRYTELQSEFKDTHYMNKLQTMLHK